MKTTTIRGTRWLAVRALAAFLLASIAADQALAGDWPQWRGPKMDGISEETGWLSTWPDKGPKTLWKANVGVGYSTVSISNGRLYTMGNTADVDAVSCLDAATGAAIWKHTYPCPAKDPNRYNGTRSTPTVDGKHVYTISRVGHVFCLETAGGKVVWSKDFKADFGGKAPTWGYASSALIEGDLLIVEPGGKGASAAALDKTTGKVVWQAGDDPASYASPMPFDLNGERCVAFFNVFGLVGRRLKDGQELWRHPWKTSWDINPTTPIIEGNRVFISSGYNVGGALLEFTANSIKVVWQNKNMRNHVNSCILWKGHLYGFDERELKCLDFQTGQVKWAEKKYGKGSLKLAGGKFLVYSDRGRVAVADLSPDGCKELAGAQVFEGVEGAGCDTWAYPVLANGRLYCRSLENLICLDVRGE